MEDGFQQAVGFGLGDRELLFQPVAEGHQFVHLGDDAVLFGQGRPEPVKRAPSYSSWRASHGTARGTTAVLVKPATRATSGLCAG